MDQHSSLLAPSVAKPLVRKLSTLNPNNISDNFYDPDIEMDYINKKVKHCLKKYCRACGRTKVQLIDVFSDEGIKMKLKLQLNHLLLISPKDDLSTFVCTDCINKITLSYSFLSKIQKTTQTLTEIRDLFRESLMKKLKSNHNDTSNKNNKNSNALPDYVTQEATRNKFQLIKRLHDNLEKNDINNTSDASFEEFDPQDHSSRKKIVSLNQQTHQLSQRKETITECKRKYSNHNTTDYIDYLDKENKSNKRKLETNVRNFNQQFDMKKSKSNTFNIDDNPIEIFSEDDVYINNLEKQFINRLKLILQIDDDQVISNFMNHLKESKFFIWELSDEEILALYKIKYNLESIEPKLEISDNDLQFRSPFIEDQNFSECDFCFETFETEELAMEHSKIHEIKLWYDCDKCYKPFSSEVSCDIHKKGCSGKPFPSQLNVDLIEVTKEIEDFKKEHICYICGENFKTLEILNLHLIEHLQPDKESILVKKGNSDDFCIKEEQFCNQTIYQCEEGQETFTLRNEASKHMIQMDSIKIFSCDICEATFDTRSTFMYHKKRVHNYNNNRIECTVCLKLIRPEDYDEHMTTHKNLALECPRCDKIFSNHAELKVHMSTHESIAEFKCKVCGATFARKYPYQQHMLLHEKDKDKTQEKAYSCAFCSKTFSNYTTMLNHRRQDHNDDKAFTCPICNKTLDSADNLKTHILTSHNRKKRSPQASETLYKCDDCQKVFRSELQIKNHRWTVHNIPIACNECNREFTDVLKLRAHWLKHTTERPYPCDMCDFKGKTKGRLIRHHQNIHSEERPYQCQYCPQRFKQATSVQCHERTHTNERPYVCSVCGVAFRQMGDKNRHEKRHKALGGPGFKRNSGPRKNCSNDVFKTSKDRNSKENSGRNDEIRNNLSGFSDDDSQTNYDDYLESESDSSYSQTDKYREEDPMGEIPNDNYDSQPNSTEFIVPHIEEEVIESEIITDEIPHGEMNESDPVYIQVRNENGEMEFIPIMSFYNQGS